MRGPARAGTVVAALVVAGVAAVLAAPTASAGQGGSVTPGGYTATAQVRFSGDAAPGGGGGSTMSVSVPATCWYDTAPGAGLPGSGTGYDPSDALSVQKAWERAVAAGGRDLPPKSVIDEAVAAQARGETRTFLMYWCYDASVDVDADPVFNSARRYIFGGPGLPVPPPRVDPKDLAVVAQQHMVIDPPDVDRNPKIGLEGNGTLVRLPTWFWVTNPDSVGGADGTRTIRAEILGTPVFAEVTARTDGLTITSAAGGTSCPPGVATTAYSAGASDASGCTVSFQRASVGRPGGYTVTASTVWTASWVGRTQDGAIVGDADLPTLARSTPFQVPVAETQALVSGAR